MNRKVRRVDRTKADMPLPRSRFFSIANQLRYGLVLLVGLSLLLTAGTLIWLSFQAQLRQIEVSQHETSRTAAGEINAYLDDLQRKLSYLARVQGLTDFSPETQHSLLEGLTRHNDAYETVAILDEMGQVVTAVSPYGPVTLANLADSPLYLRAFKQKEDFVSPVELEPETHLPMVTIAVPIRDQQDQVDGVLLARVNLNFLWFIVSQTNVGETGYAYVIDDRNFLIAKKGDTPETFELEDISDRPFIQSLTTGELDSLPPPSGWAGVMALIQNLIASEGDPLITYQGLEDENVLGDIAPIHSVRWNVIVELPTSEAYARVWNMLVVMGIALGVATVVTTGLGIFFSRQIIIPLQQLTEASTQIRAGNLDTQAQINSRNELGVLATTFNQMATQLKELYATLEQRVIDRTQRLELVATLSERLIGILNLEELLTEGVNQLKANFDYYHAQIYLLDEAGENLVVVAGTGPAGAEMKARGHSIPCNAPTSLVARAARSGQIVSVENVREAEDWLPNSLLPDTYAEMAVPIILEERVVGVLDVQKDEIAGLDESDASLLRSLANQVAVTMRNARLFQQVETALAEARAAQERYLERAWAKNKATARGNQYLYAQPGSAPLNEAKRRAMVEARQQALKQGQAAVVTLQDNGSQAKSLVAPINLRDKTIGAVQLHPAGRDQGWSEDDLAVIEAVMEQLAQTAENLRLFDEARSRAGREQTIRQITERMRAATSLEELIRITACELGEQLSAGHAVVELEMGKVATNLEAKGVEDKRGGNEFGSQGY